MNRNRPSARKPQTRRGGAILFRGVEYATAAELEQALVDALVQSGWKLTAKGEGYVEAMREMGAA